MKNVIVLFIVTMSSIYKNRWWDKNKYYWIILNKGRIKIELPSFGPRDCLQKVSIVPKTLSFRLYCGSSHEVSEYSNAKVHWPYMYIQATVICGDEMFLKNYIILKRQFKKTHKNTCNQILRALLSTVYKLSPNYLYIWSYINEYELFHG